MHEDDPIKGEAATELAPGPLTSRRAALLRVLAGTGAAYAVPLAASFSMGGLSLPTAASAAPFGNQCFGNQLPFGQSYYRIAVRAEYTLDGVRSRRLVPASFIVEIQSILISDDTGWTAEVQVWFAVDGDAPLLLYPAASLVVSNASATFALIFANVIGGYNLRGGGPLVLTRRGIAALTADSPYPARPITAAGVTFGADITAVTDCGILQIHRMLPLATLSTTGIETKIVPSGVLPPAIVPSGAL